MDSGVVDWIFEKDPKAKKFQGGEKSCLFYKFNLDGQEAVAKIALSPKSLEEINQNKQEYKLGKECFQGLFPTIFREGPNFLIIEFLGKNLSERPSEEFFDPLVEKISQVYQSLKFTSREQVLNSINYLLTHQEKYIKNYLISAGVANKKDLERLKRLSVPMGSIATYVSPFKLSEGVIDILRYFQ